MIDESIIGIAQVISSGAVAIALYFTVRTFGQTRNAHQIQLGERFYSEMQQVRRDLSPYFDLDKTSQAYGDKIKLQDEITFNTLEWYSLLIRGNKMKDKSIINYFRNEIIKWHDEIFFEVVEDKDRSKYTQFQQLVKELKLGKYASGRFKRYKDGHHEATDASAIAASPVIVLMCIVNLPSFV